MSQSAPMNEVAAEVPIGGVQFCWLLECFTRDGTSRGIYWRGYTNTIRADARGLMVTFDVQKARRIPFDMMDVAEALAAAVNKAYPVSDGSHWRAIQHGFGV